MLLNNNNYNTRTNHNNKETLTNVMPYKGKNTTRIYAVSMALRLLWLHLYENKTCTASWLFIVGNDMKFHHIRFSVT